MVEFYGCFNDLMEEIRRKSKEDVIRFTKALIFAEYQHHISYGFS